MAMAKNPLHCSFCGRSRDEVKILIAGQEGHICENCVEHAREIIDQELMVRDEKTALPHFKLTVKKPMEIKKFLDEYVIGQDEAKKVLQLQFTITTNDLQQKSAIATMMLKLKKAISSWWVKPEPVKPCWQKQSPEC